MRRLPPLSLISPSRFGFVFVAVVALVAPLSLVLAGCGGDDDDMPDPPDLGVVEDSAVPADLGPMDQGTTEPPCTGPPGLYIADSCTILAPGVRPYRPRFELWTDAAEKERFIYLPENGVIDTSDSNAWVFPRGTILWKTFSRGGRRLETRILTKVMDGEGSAAWSFEVYGWNQVQDDVSRVGADGLENVLGTTHDIPSQADCLSCHAAGTRDVSLGFGAIQLGDALLPLSLQDLQSAGELSDAIPEATVVIPGTTIQRRALGYLHANCAHCHNGASPPVGLDMQLLTNVPTVCETSTYVTGLGAVQEASTCQTPGINSGWGGGIKRVEPGIPDTSALWLRMNTRDTLPMQMDQMPPLGTEETDVLGQEAVRTWILTGI